MLQDTINEPTSLDDVLANTLGWEVMEKPMFYKDLDGSTDVLSDKKITYRVATSKEGQPELVKLGEVSNKYVVMQNEKFVNDDRDIYESGLLTLVGAGSLRQGSVVFMQYLVNSIEPVEGDKYNCYLMKFNSHDGSRAYGWCATSERVRCRNKFNAVLANKATQKLTARHTKNLHFAAAEIQESLDLVNGGFIATEEKLKRLAAITIESEEQIRKVVKVAFSQKDAEKALEDDERKPRMLDPIIHLFHNGIGHDLDGFKGTGLALWNAITEHNNHYSGSKSTYDSRVESVLFGAGSRINEKAESAILALAK